MRLFGDENLNEAIDSAEREMADLRASLKQAATAYEGRCNMLTERCAAAEKEAGLHRNRADGFEGDIRFITKAYFEAGLGSTPTTPDKVAERLREIPALIGKVEALTKEAEFQRTRANELAGDRDRASAFAARLQDMLAKTQKDFADVTACLAEMSGGRVTNYDFTHRGKGENHVQQLLVTIREGVEQDRAQRREALKVAEAKAAELRRAEREAADFLGVLARVHEVFDNLQPGCAGRLGGAWRLYEAGWRADQTVEEAHRLLGRRMGERMAHPDPIVCALIEATKSQWTGPDAVKALAPLALATCSAPDEALVANLESAMADRDNYREALLAAGMSADEPEPIKWAMARAQECSDNEAIVRMLGITAWVAPVMDPDPAATLVELFQASMPPGFTLGANRKDPAAVVWSWQTDVCGQGFATPLLALEGAWIRHCALVEAKARKEADRAAADQHSTLHRALVTIGMPDGCKDPQRWADVHLDGWKTMQSSLTSLGVSLYEVSGSDVADLAELELLCDERHERMDAPVLARTSQHPELGQMVTVTIPWGFGQTLAGLAADLAKARGALHRLGMPEDCKEPEEWAGQTMRVRTDANVHTPASIAERFPEASHIVVVDPRARVFGGAQDDRRVRIVNSDIGHSEAQERADVVVVVRSDGTLFVRKNRHGLVGEIIELGPASHPGAYMGVDLAKDGASDSTVVTARHGAGGWKIEGPVPAKAPGWTGITWTSRKGKAKSVSVPGMVLASGIAEGTSGPFTSVDIPEGVAHLPMDLLRRVRYGGLLTFHMGDLKRTGIISGVDRATRYDRLRIEIAES